MAPDMSLTVGLLLCNSEVYQFTSFTNVLCRAMLPQGRTRETKLPGFYHLAEKMLRTCVQGTSSVQQALHLQLLL